MGKFIAIFFVCLWCFGCAKPEQPTVTPQPASTQPTTTALANAQADTREIGKTLAESSANMQAIATDVRADAKAVPEPVRTALEGKADRLVHESASVGAQAKLVDPGVTRQLEAARQHLAEMHAENKRIVDGLVAQHQREVAEFKEREAKLKEEHEKAIAGLLAKITDAEKRESQLAKKLEDARSLRIAAWFLLAGIVAGVALVAVKAHPALSWLPGELGGGIAGGCLVGLLYIHTRDEYPLATAIAGLAFMLALVVPSVVRINKLQSKVST